MIPDEDVLIETHTNASPVVLMRIIHMPTGITASGAGKLRWKLREALLAEIAEKINPQLHSEPPTPTPEP
jgi:hypothetical protein